LAKISGIERGRLTPTIRRVAKLDAYCILDVYGIKTWAEVSIILPEFTHLTDRQTTNERTDCSSEDGSCIAAAW